MKELEKTYFFDNFAEMIGKDYYYETADPEKDLFGRFCNGRKNKLLIDLDEARSKDTFANSEVLKNMITSQTFNYEQKGIDPIIMQNFARMIFTTNNDMCIKVTDNTRRYVIYETSNEKIGNQQYFSDLVNYMKDKKNQKTIIKYLRNIDISGYNFITERPISETYEALRSICGDIMLQFLGHYYLQNRHEDNITDLGSSIYQEFQNYIKDVRKLSQEQQGYWTNMRFAMKMNRILKSDNGITKIRHFGSSRLLAYKMDIKILKIYLEKKGILTKMSYEITDD